MAFRSVDFNLISCEKGSGSASSSKKPKDFKKLNRRAKDVAAVGKDANSRKRIMELSIECQTSREGSVADEGTMAWGVSNHAFHLHCSSRWLNTDQACPLELAGQQCNKQRRHKWLWSSLSLTLCIGIAAIGWSYIPPPKPTKSDCEE